MWCLIGLLASGLLWSCTEDGSCTFVQCSGGPVVIPLADDANLPVAARGEYRTNRRGAEPRGFDCTQPARASSGADACENGQVTADVFDIWPGTILQVRFDQKDGTWSDWQDVAVQLEEHTDPDFNGPGCECTWYTATASPVVVPADAR